MSTKLGDQNSDEWERIKNYVGGANKPAKHPIQQEMDRIDMRKPQHLDDGGMVDPLSEDSKNLLTPASIGAPNPFQALSPASAPASAPQIQRPMTPPPAAAVPPPPQAPPMAAQMPPPAAAPMPDSSYGPQATQALGGMDPQKLQQFLQTVNTPGLKDRLGNAGTGFADAIMQGVARAGPGHFQENFQKANQDTRENLSRIPGAVSQQGKEQYGLTKEMASDDPKSMRSYVLQNANAPLLKQAGFTSAEIKQIPASAIEELQKGSLSADEIRAKFGLEKATIENTAAYQQGMLRNTGASIANTASNQALGHQETAMEALEKRGFLEKAKDAFFPSEETKELQREAAGGSPKFTPDVTAYAQKHGITPEQAQTIKDKRTGG